MQHDEIKNSPAARNIVLFKCLATAPFYLMGVIDPSMSKEYCWVLYMEAFHHYHARIFYMCLLYKNCTQMCFAVLGNGHTQRTAVKLDGLFDVVLVLLYIHEYYKYHTFSVLFSKFAATHMVSATLTLYALRRTLSIKLDHVV